MADGKQVKTIDNENLREIQDLVAAGKAFTFRGSEISKAYEESGEYYVEAVSSSDQEDLVGDVFTSKALGQMKAGFVGKTAFMNHRTNIPDDVFGSIVAADLEKKDGMQLLILKFVVESSNPPAMKTWGYIEKGRVKLGTSVTVLIASPPKNNPARKGGIIIDDIEPIEVSIVGVPCNRESWTMTATATKALKLANLSDEEDVMKTEKSESVETEVVAAETVEEQDPGSTAAEAPESEEGKAEAPAVEEKALLPRTMAAIARYKTMVAEVTESKVAKTAVEMENVAAKGMFADMVAHPPFYDLVDILFDVYWSLRYQIWNLQYAGETDFSEITAAWTEALGEFAAAAADSFTFWEVNAGQDPEDGEGDDLVSMSLEEAGQIVETLKTLAGIIENTAGPTEASSYRALGTSILEIAAKAGIPFPAAEAVEIEAQVGEIDVTKTEKFIEVATRAQEAEDRASAAEAAVKALEAQVSDLQTTFSETEETLEITKAGLKAAVEATSATLRQPLHVTAGKN